MSWVRKALDKARNEKAILDGLDQTGSSRVISPASEQGTYPAKQVYSRTRVVSVPNKVLLANRVVTVEEDHPASDQFKLLRTRLFQQMRPNGINTIQVTGFQTGDGKSTVAVNLAVSIAKDARQTTLLVDLDFRRPSIARLLGLDENLPGLTSYFLDGLELESIFVSPGIDKLTVLPAGGVLNDAPEVLGSPRMEALVKELKGRYPDRFIVFDTPPINECPDPLIFSEFVDAMLLVARCDHTQSDDIEAAMDMLPKHKVLGLVLNDSRLPQDNYAAYGKGASGRRGWPPSRWFRKGAGYAGIAAR